MLNVFEALRSPSVAEILPSIRKFVVGQLLFASFTCPGSGEWEASWAEHDCIMHVTLGRKTLRAGGRIWSLRPGDTIFLKKGVSFLRQDTHEDVCIFVFFIPDEFIRTSVREIAADLPRLTPPMEPRDMALPVRHDAGVVAFLEAMKVFFSAKDDPAEILLKLKMKELVASLVVSASNTTLSAYLRWLAGRDAPSIPSIMEANCFHNLSIGAFATLCGRSLSTFKREFRQHYGVSPGRWLLEQRLECAARLLSATSTSITDVVYECGFEHPAHFTRAFKLRFGQTPTEYRETNLATG